MAETWTCGICETVCDGARCPVCGADRTAAVVNDPLPSPPPGPIPDDDGDWEREAAKEAQMRSIRSGATWCYILFLAVYIPSAWQAFDALFGMTLWVDSVWAFITAVIPVLLLVLVTVAFVKTNGCEAGAERVAGNMLLWSVLGGVWYIGYWMICYTTRLLLHELFVPVALLFGFLLWQLAGRIPKE